MKIVVVEDVPMIRERIVDAVGDVDGVDIVGEADSVETALTTIEDSEPDAIVLDISLPSAVKIKNGIGVLRWVKQTHPDITVVMLSNHSDPAYREACTEAGAFAFLDKSKEFDQLPDLIESLQLTPASTTSSQPPSRAADSSGRSASSASQDDSAPQSKMISRRSLPWAGLLIGLIRVLDLPKADQRR